MDNNDRLFIDLTDINIEEVEVLAQEGSRGLAELAASTGTCNGCGTCSCVIQQDGSGS
jgi:bacterioferritin-associated ferredoxin